MERALPPRPSPCDMKISAWYVGSPLCRALLSTTSALQFTIGGAEDAGTVRPGDRRGAEADRERFVGRGERRRESECLEAD
mmetsp:Transcript_70789/g.163654  ORF Transcript_70789/g.163654 Transcript_70789/m.163654 type:complete len:81 (+) Transcript_70789:262-504(+)